MASYPKKNKHEEDFSQTILTSARAITWKIRNIKTLPETADYSLDSPPFVFENATWCLRLYPKVSEAYYSDSDLTSDDSEEGEKEQGYIGFTLVRLRSCVPHHRLQYHLLWEENDNYSKHVFSVDFDEGHKESGSKTFIKRSYAFGKTHKLCKTGILILICHVSCYRSPSLDDSSLTKTVNQNTKGIGALCQNYRTLLLSGQDHDVVLKVKDKKFRAHQIILKARSPVLESMLNHDMMEKNSGVVDIPDCDPNAFEQFLIYLYCAKMETLDSGNMLSLYYIADKYDVGHLKEECSEFIKKSLSTRNIGDVIQLATHYSDADLLQCATDYFVEHVKVILPTVEWQSFIQRNTIQANELFIKAVNKMSGGNS